MQLQMTIWSISSAPLFMSTHVPSIHNDSKAILLNRGALAINADPLGRMPFRYASNATGEGVDLWRKELAGGEVALAVVNMGANNLTSGSAALILDLLDAGFSPDTRVSVHDVFEEKDMGWHSGQFRLSRALPTHSAVLLRLSYSPQYSRKVEGWQREL